MPPPTPPSKSASDSTSTSTYASPSDPKPARQRQPPPTLFQAPPTLSHSLSHALSRSPNTSHLSLPLPPPSNTNANGNPTATTAASTKPLTPAPAHHLTRDTHTDTNTDTDALWRSMQHTLAEVELTAASARTQHVFGAQHAATLAQLRGAQITLAQAWARGGGGGGEEEDGVVVEDAVPGRGVEGATSAEMAAGGGGGGVAGSGIGGKGKEGIGNGNGNGNGGGGKGAGRERRGSLLAEETRSDVLLARKRREANDRYFARVSAGVQDVVERLEGVAGAMRAVERESRDVWSSAGESEGESAGGSRS